MCIGSGAQSYANSICIGTSTVNHNSNNVCIGNNQILTNNTTSCTIVGSNAVCSTNFSNSSALGYQATIPANNTIQLGNTAITSFRCQVALTVVSDGRNKVDIEPLNTWFDALEYINSIECKKYHMNDRNKYIECVYDEDGKLQDTIQHPNDGSKKDADYSIGFISQDVDVVEQELLGENILVNKSVPDKLGIRYEAGIPILFQAVQDLHKMLLDLKTENQELRNRIQVLENS